MASVNPHVMSPKAWPSEIERCIKELGFVGIKLHTVGHTLSPASKDEMTELVKAKKRKSPKTGWSPTIGTRPKTSSTLGSYLSRLMNKI